MDVRRAVPVALDVDSDDAALLEDTVDTFLWCAQYVVDHAFHGAYVTTSKTTLNVNGGSSPTSPEVRAGVHAESHPFTGG